jgi:hypothetical protein
MLNYLHHGLNIDEKINHPDFLATLITTQRILIDAPTRFQATLNYNDQEVDSSLRDLPVLQFIGTGLNIVRF